MKKFNKYINYGLLFNSIFLLINGSGIFPEFIKGICAGVCFLNGFLNHVNINKNNKRY